MWVFSSELSCITRFRPLSCRTSHSPELLAASKCFQLFVAIRVESTRVGGCHSLDIYNFRLPTGTRETFRNNRLVCDSGSPWRHSNTFPLVFSASPPPPPEASLLFLQLLLRSLRPEVALIVASLSHKKLLYARFLISKVANPGVLISYSIKFSLNRVFWALSLHTCSLASGIDRKSSFFVKHVT